MFSMRRLDQGKKTMKRRVQIDNKIVSYPEKTNLTYPLQK